MQAPRKIAKVKRPQPEITGTELIKDLEINQVKNYGYKILLAKPKIEAMFTPEIAKSKKKRITTLKKFLQEAMRDVLDVLIKDKNKTVNDFIKATEEKLIEKKAELETMSPSPIEMEVMPIAPAAKVTGKRKKAASPAAAAAASSPRRSPPRVPLMDDANIAGPGPAWKPEDAAAAMAAARAAAAKKEQGPSQYWAPAAAVVTTTKMRDRSSTSTNSSVTSPSSQERPQKRAVILTEKETESLVNIFKKKGNVSRRKAELTPALKKQLEELAAKKEKEDAKAKELEKARLANIQRYVEERAAAPVDKELAKMFNKRAGL